MTPASHPPVRHRWRLRDVLRKLHLWLGLSIGVLFAVLALSGTVLAYQAELLKWRHPELTRHALPTAEQQAAVLQHIQDTRWPLPLRSVDLPDADLPVYELFLDGQVRVYLDPADGKQLLLRSPDNDAVLWLRYLHTHLLGGKTGELWLGVIGIVELSLLLIGLVLWWPRNGHWRHAVHMYAQPPIRRWRSWHQSVGAIALPLLLLSTLTGITLIYKDTTRAALSSLFGDRPLASKLPTLAPREAPVQWTAALAAAQAALPQAELHRITLPSAKNATLTIRARGAEEWNVVGRSVVVVDPYTATVMAVQDAQQQGRGNRWSDNIYPLHAGAVGGSTWQFVIAVVGVLPAFFAVTGFLFWWTRTRHRKAVQRAIR